MAVRGPPGSTIIIYKELIRFNNNTKPTQNQHKRKQKLSFSSRGSLYSSVFFVFLVACLPYTAGGVAGGVSGEC